MFPVDLLRVGHTRTPARSTGLAPGRYGWTSQSLGPAGSQPSSARASTSRAGTSRSGVSARSSTTTSGRGSASSPPHDGVADLAALTKNSICAGGTTDDARPAAVVVRRSVVAGRARRRRGPSRASPARQTITPSDATTAIARPGGCRRRGHRGARRARREVGATEPPQAS